MNVQRIAAFSQGDQGGNPAGVVLLQDPASTDDMARVAAEVGYSETAFAVQQDTSAKHWRVRYFSPESEVPFCGHATIALGAVLGDTHGAGTYDLALNEAAITVETAQSGDGMQVTLASPPTRSQPISDKELSDALTLFGLDETSLDNRLAPARIHGGADHLVLPLADRATLAAIDYDLAQGRNMMLGHNLITIMLVHIAGDQHFNVRNPFASGGVIEDPATGAAAAAFAGYLRDQNWPHGGAFTIHQGHDMGQPSVINVALTDEIGSSIRVSGRARKIN